MTSNPGQQNPFAAPEPGPRPPAPQQPMVPNFIPPTVAAAAANPKPKSRVSVGSLAFVVAIVVAAAGLGFAGGRLTAPASTGRGNFAGGNFAGGGAGANASGNPNRGGFGGFGGGAIAVTGQVTAIANGSITVQTASGQSVTLQVPSTATYHAQTGATATDVTVGSNVAVTMTSPNARPDASGGTGGQRPAASPGGFQMSVTDITVLAK